MIRGIYKKILHFKAPTWKFFHCRLKRRSSHTVLKIYIKISCWCTTPSVLEEFLLCQTPTHLKGEVYRSRNLQHIQCMQGCVNVHICLSDSSNKLMKMDKKQNSRPSFGRICSFKSAEEIKKACYDRHFMQFVWQLGLWMNSVEGCKFHRWRRSSRFLLPLAELID